MPNLILNIITAVSRELNIYLIDHELRKIKNLDVRWYLIYDGISMTSIKIPEDIKYYHAEISNPKKRDSSGAVQKNIALSKITEGWIYVLDDDNSIHPNFEKEFSNAIKKYPNKKAFVFSQVNYKNKIMISSKQVRETTTKMPFENWAVDAGGYVIHYDLVKKTNARYLEFKHESDRYFWKYIIENCLNEIEFIDKPCFLYNALRYERHKEGHMSHNPYSQEEQRAFLHVKKNRINYKFKITKNIIKTIKIRIKNMIKKRIENSIKQIKI